MTTDAVEKIQEPTVVFKKRGRSKYRKQIAKISSSDSDSDNGSDEEIDIKVKRHKRNHAAITASIKSTPASTIDVEPTRYAAERNETIKSSNDATKSSNWFDEHEVNNLSEKNLLGSTRNKVTNESEKLYKGLANQTKFIVRNENAPKRVVGPIKAPANLRTITVTDFAPDVCKDYKQTGFCGFGDSCKYLHAREDYKHGWQLDKEWENVTKDKKLKAGTTIASINRKVDDEESEDDETMLENIPFACILCKEKYQNPVVTKCRHYFCESCALKRYKKYQSCAACGSSTGGVFNIAKNLKKLLDRKRERAFKKREKALQNGEDVSDEEI
ncbi:Pre-mRNA-splicing factor cwc24 [Erysiphe necator]|uniref:Pre-mRNA-splicing factor CWC24 n=1 Tax=Uncinula necator TaxID=52586 RepID=A0A0B1PAH6_UNCNE|nr:Pre-mRNA-splicing factor cwc24 [Erysiphe necator]KHJ33971.1 putative pre-mrna splicing factor cwc24 [Erysiphe necator]